MGTTLVIHVVAGGLALASGYLALYAPKGRTVHRRSGMVFVLSMLVMCTLGMVLAVLEGSAPAINVPAALVTTYLVFTALIAVRPIVAPRHWLHVAALMVAVGVGVVCLGFGIEAAGGVRRQGMPPFPYFMFATVALLGAAGDVRWLRAGSWTSQARIARHLWRMTYALLIAAMSFFLGQADEIPQPLRPFGALPVLAVLLTLLYWVWRVRSRRWSWRYVPEPARLPHAPLAAESSPSRFPSETDMRHSA